MNKRKCFKQFVAITAALSCITMTGCGSFVSADVTKYELVPALTTQEVIDYYAKALEYDSIVTRAADDNKAVVTYNVNPVSPSKEERLQKLVSKAEQMLSSNEYSYESDNTDIMSKDTWVYVKSVLDNLSLSNGSIVEMGGALGFYFVDVEYDLSASTPGQFTEYSDMLGLSGVWMKTATGEYRVNVGYLESAMQKLNQYFADNNIMKCAYYDQSTLIFQILDGVDPRTYLTETTTTSGGVGLLNNIPETNENGTEENGDGIEEGANETGEAEGAEVENGNQESDIDNTNENSVDTENDVNNTPENNTEASDTENSDTETEEPSRNIPVPTVQPGEAVQSDIVSYESFTDPSRMPALDNNLINSVVGSSLTGTAFLPYIDLVYKPSISGGISGMGIYPQANSGLRLFGYDRSKVNGTITLRYVFKDDVNATGKFVGTNIYVLSEEILTGANVASDSVLIPKYLEDQLKRVIERADRVQANVDIAGMMNGKIYEDKGFAVLAGFRDSGTYTGMYMSTLRQVLKRDLDNNAYLVEVETTVMEGPRSSNCFGTYKDKAYMVIQQQGTEFIISDYALESRTMVSEPPINPDKAIDKRLVALNLAGVVEDNEKDACRQLMSDLYTAGTNRLLNARTLDDGTVMKGMYDCFNNDTELLSSDNKEYMNSELRNRLTKYGTNTSSTHTGNITEFIGGWDNQVEFTTEELITYAGRDEGYYMSVYYLVSRMNDIWVIDERTVMDERDVSGSELQGIRERLGQ